MTEHPITRMQRIAQEVQTDPEWRDRDEVEQYTEYRRRVLDVPESYVSEEADHG